MTQVPATYRQIGDTIDYTPDSAVTAGDVVVFGTNLITIAPCDIAANEKRAVATRGVFNVPKDSSNVTAGMPAYWDADGDPVGGTAGTGAFTSNSALGPFAGFFIEAAGAGVGDCDMVLRSVDSATVPGSFAAIPVATVTVGGTAIGNANALADGFSYVTGADDTAAVKLPPAAEGKICIVKNAVANKILKVFPTVDDTINAGAANAVYNQGNGALRVYVAYNAVAWYTAPEGENV